MVEWRGEEAVVPELPYEYKLFKVVGFFGLEKDRDLAPEDVDFLFDKMRLLAALDALEFPAPRGLF